MFRLIKRNLKGAALLCTFLAPLLIFIEVLMDLQQPTLMSDIVDIGVKNRNLGYIWTTGLKMVLCAFTGAVGGAGCGVLASFASVTLGGSLREKLFHKIQSLSYAEIDRFKTSSLITRLTNDVTQIQNMFSMLLRGMVRSPMLCIGGILMSFLLSPRLAVVFCVVLPILITCVAVVIKRSVPLYTQMQSWLDRVNTVMRENLLGVRVVKAFNMEDRQNASFRSVNDGFTEKSIQAQNLTFTLMPIVTLVMNLTVVVILWFGGNMAVSGNLEIGKIMAFVNYLVQITNSLMMLVNLIINISRAQASAVRIHAVFDTVGENMRFGNEKADETEMEDALRMAQAEDFIGALPDKLQSRVEQRGKNFSGGQKQRLSIARTLLKKPKILILDDSTSALDLATEARLQQELAQKMRGRTVIVIAQRISGVMDLDVILMLDHGRIAAQGTHRELLQCSEVYRNIAVSQLGEEALRLAAE